MNPRKSLADLPETFVSSTEITGLVSRAMRQGLLRQIGPKVYTKNLRDTPEKIIKTNVWQLVSRLVPGALIADRTALEALPAEDGSIFVVADRKRDIELPGLIIRPRKGPPPLDGFDRPFINGLFISSEARQYLDNLVRSRERGGRSSRTVSRAELEERLERKTRLSGAEAMNKLRDDARRIAPVLGRESEFLELNQLISGLLGAHDAQLVTPQGRARQFGQPFDPDRFERLELLFRALRTGAPSGRLAKERNSDARTTQAFFEAYFSNYIEGTKFPVSQASDIVFRGVIPENRPEDAHDIIGTWNVVSDQPEMARTPETAKELFELLRRRHAAIMEARPEKHPGVFKVMDNQAGSTMFVPWQLVEGTLIQAFDLYRALETPFARAVYMMFMIAEIHPFTDGNGRVARIMMNAELVAGGQERIIIPTIYRDNYISALRVLSLHNQPTPLVRVLDFAQKWVAAVQWADLNQTTGILTRNGAFLESSEADELGVRFRLPEDVQEP